MTIPKLMCSLMNKKRLEIVSVAVRRVNLVTTSVTVKNAVIRKSTQVPATWVYVSDGTYKEYAFDNTVIQFKRTTNKEVSKLSYKTAITIQALKALGKDKIDESVINNLRKLLTAEEKTIMLHEAKTATSWIYEYIRQICRG